MKHAVPPYLASRESVDRREGRAARFACLEISLERVPYVVHVKELQGPGLHLRGAACVRCQRGSSFRMSRGIVW
jgi:hypothetical protein